MSNTVRIATLNDASQRSTIIVPVRIRDGVATLDDALLVALDTFSFARSDDGNWVARLGLSEKPGAHAMLRAAGEPTVVLVSVGAGDPDGFRQGAAAGVRLAGGDAASFLLAVDEVDDAFVIAQAVAEGAVLAAYDYKRSAAPAFDLVPVGRPLPTVASHDAAAAGARRGAVVASAVNWARQLINTPANLMTPREMARVAIELFEAAPHVRIEAWTESRARAEGLGGLLGVGQGSAQPTRLLYGVYDPEPTAPLVHVALVGKGITFDSGGLSLKPADSMMNQKTDMSGAAIVLGALRAISELGVAVRLSVIAPMAENLPGSRSVKPGDVLTIRNGLTVEVLNTDAEGRLVLADGLSLATESAPDLIIDIATLTGAQRVALGDEVGALYASHDDVAAAVLAAGSRSGEQLWRMPLTDSYEGQLDSDVADLKNIGKIGLAGSVVAALFLRRFTGGRPWAHFDIAGPGRSDAARGYTSKGGTAFGLRTIVEVIDAVARRP